MSRRDRIPISLVLLTILVLGVSCAPNTQIEALTPIPTLAPAGVPTLIPALQEPGGGGDGGGEPVASPAPEGGNADAGATVFSQNCASCHGEGAAGGSVGPTLISAEMKAKADDYYRQVINNGIEGTAMPAWGGRLSPQEIEDVIAYLRSLQ